MNYSTLNTSTDTPLSTFGFTLETIWTFWTMLANSTIILLLRLNPQWKKLSSSFVCHLAVVDMLLVLNLALFTAVHSNATQWAYFAETCVGMVEIMLILLTASGYSVVSLLVNQYIAIVTPKYFSKGLQIRRLRTCLFFMYTWLIVIASNYPNIAWTMLKIEEEKTTGRGCGNYKSPIYTLYLVTAIYFIPSLIQIIMYTCLLFRWRRADKNAVNLVAEESRTDSSNGCNEDSSSAATSNTYQDSGGQSVESEGAEPETTWLDIHKEAINDGGTMWLILSQALLFMIFCLPMALSYTFFAFDIWKLTRSDFILLMWIAVIKCGLDPVAYIATNKSLKDVILRKQERLAKFICLRDSKNI